MLFGTASIRLAHERTGCSQRRFIPAKVACGNDDWPWLVRHRWFFAACGRLFNDKPVVPFDR
jgi:hypothetical protein